MDVSVSTAVEESHLLRLAVDVEMIETVVGDIEESRCCGVSDAGDISALNLGMIAA